MTTGLAGRRRWRSSRRTISSCCRRTTARCAASSAACCSPASVLDVDGQHRQRARPARHRGQHRERRRRVPLLHRGRCRRRRRRRRHAARQPRLPLHLERGASASCRARQLILDLPVTPGPNHDGGMLVLGPRRRRARLAGRRRQPAVRRHRRSQPQRSAPEHRRRRRAGRHRRDPARRSRTAAPAPGNPFVPYCSVTTTTDLPERRRLPGRRDLPHASRRATTPTACATASAWRSTRHRRSVGHRERPRRLRRGQSRRGRLQQRLDADHGPRRARPAGRRRSLPHARRRQSPTAIRSSPGSTPVAPTGIVFPSGSALGPAYDDVALVGDFNNGNLYRFPLNGGRTGFDLSRRSTGSPTWSPTTSPSATCCASAQGFGGITDLKIGPDGNLYVVSLGAGAIYRLRGPTPTRAERRADATDSGDRPVAAIAPAHAGRRASWRPTSSADRRRSTSPRRGQGTWQLVARTSRGTCATGCRPLDAVHVLQTVAGTRPFNAAQTLACDVTGDGTCSDARRDPHPAARRRHPHPLRGRRDLPVRLAVHPRRAHRSPIRSTSAAGVRRRRRVRWDASTTRRWRPTRPGRTSSPYCSATSPATGIPAPRRDGAQPAWRC